MPEFIKWFNSLERGKNLPLQNLHLSATQRTKPNASRGLYKRKGLPSAESPKQRLQRKNLDGNQIPNGTELSFCLPHRQGVRKGGTGNNQKNQDNKKKKREKNQQKIRKTDRERYQGTPGVGGNIFAFLIFFDFFSFFLIKFF